MTKWARPLAAKKSPMSPKVPGKGHGSSTDRHAPKLPPIKGPGQKSNQLPGKGKGK